MCYDCLHHPLQPGANDGTRHGKVQTNIAFSIADKEGVSTLEQNTGVVGKEAGEVVYIRKTV